MAQTSKKHTSGELDHSVYSKLREQSNDLPSQVFKVVKGLYGLKHRGLAESCHRTDQSLPVLFAQPCRCPWPREETLMAKPGEATAGSKNLTSAKSRSMRLSLDIVTAIMKKETLASGRTLTRK